MDRQIIVIGGGVIVAGGLAFVAYGALFGDFRSLKDHQPDSPLVQGKTGYRLVDDLLPSIRDIYGATEIPLGLVIAWICKESGGKLSSHTSLDERGYFQLMPAESRALGLDHQRLSVDRDYSLRAGLPLIRRYAADVAALGIASAPSGSEFAVMLTKLVHTVGLGQTRKWVKAAQAAGAMGSWDEFAQFVQSKSWTGPQPKKWIPFMNSILALGAPFGFGSAAPTVAGFYDPRGADPRTPFYDPHGVPGCFPPKSRSLLGLDIFAARRAA